MGLNETPPHVPSTYTPIGIALLGIGGILYTITYYLMTRQAQRDRTYAMPLLPLAFNFAWEATFLFYVSEEVHEKVIFTLWILIDIGLVHDVIRYGANEWTHAPVIAKNLGKILAVMVAWWGWALFAVCRWWITNDVGRKVGIVYQGVEGPDVVELGFWTALVAQVVLSFASLAQILVRRNTGGTSYTIWTCRVLGSLSGLNANYLWLWWAWPEAHEYLKNPFAICLLVSWVVADMIYLFVLMDAKRTEVVLKDGRKVAGSQHSEDDEDLKRAIALSLADAGPAHPHSPADVEDLTTKDKDGEDDELQRALALSLQESGQDTGPVTLPSSHPKAVISSLPKASGLAGMDRKAMEQERLARLGKRKRDASPDLPLKIVAKEESQPTPSQSVKKVVPSGPISGCRYPRGVIKRTWAHKHPRTDDIKIEEVFEGPNMKIAVLGAFQADDRWIFSKLNPFKTKQIWFMDAKGEDLRQKLLEEVSATGNPGLRLHFPPMEGQASSMHSKLMLLDYEDHLRIVVPTANMTKTDWGETNTDAKGISWQPAVMENSAFLIDLPCRPGREPADRAETSFGKELVHFLRAQEAPRNVIDGVLKFDFSATEHLAFVHSIPGSHRDCDPHHTGLPGLESAIRELKLNNVDKLELDYTTSSLGSLTQWFLQRVYLAASGLRPSEKAPPNFLSHIRVYFPTAETVRNSTGGADCGGIITLLRALYNSSTFVKKCLRDCKSTRPGVLSHNKMLLARGLRKDGSSFAWAYVGSANLTESAWGSQKLLKNGKEGVLSIKNWECGVVVPVPEEKLKRLRLGEGEVPDMNVFEGTVEVPFEYPGEEYRGREAWFYRD
ncbi:phospholipase D/nuclease [Lentithecium fluviatile CBS 122367]|uniref:Phospholipase D/nuclease n=1 Tax=Lentithecium fluviatile CBS 122367 TaxID=1168545 RepID=A0A6G1J9C7_9PLEO|nr:phospholipase D/nuclease [Lentithecium fluviatile CBS 122367]